MRLSFLTTWDQFPTKLIPDSKKFHEGQMKADEKTFSEIFAIFEEYIMFLTQSCEAYFESRSRFLKAWSSLTASNREIKTYEDRSETAAYLLHILQEGFLFPKDISESIFDLIQQSENGRYVDALVFLDSAVSFFKITETVIPIMKKFYDAVNMGYNRKNLVISNEVFKSVGLFTKEMRERFFSLVSNFKNGCDDKVNLLNDFLSIKKTDGGEQLHKFINSKVIYFVLRVQSTEHQFASLDTATNPPEEYTEKQMENLSNQLIGLRQRFTLPISDPYSTSYPMLSQSSKDQIEFFVDFDTEDSVRHASHVRSADSVLRMVQSALDLLS